MQRAAIYFVLFCALVHIVWSQVGTQDMLIGFVMDNLEDLKTQFNKTDMIREIARHSASFEIGFVIRNMEECYRRMVDIYNSTISTDLRNWNAHTTNFIMFLKHIEMLNWVLDHLKNMLHEIEKKYKIRSAGMFDTFVWTTATPAMTKRQRTGNTETVTIRSSTKHRQQTWWPIEYGWEVDYEWRK